MHKTIAANHSPLLVQKIYVLYQIKKINILRYYNMIAGNKHKSFPLNLFFDVLENFKLFLANKRVFEVSTKTKQKQDNERSQIRNNVTLQAVHHK